MGATLKSIAAAAGCSIRTAARALHGDPAVRPATRQRIRTLAQEQGYAPNLLARSLRSGESRLVGVIVPENPREAVSARIDAVLAALARSGRPALAAPLPQASADLKELLAAWRGLTRTVLFTAWFEGERDAAWIGEAGFNGVFYDCGAGVAEGFRIVLEREAGMSMAVDELVRQGRSRIARVTARPDGGLPVLSLPAWVEVIRLYAGGDDYRDGYRAGTAVSQAGADAVIFDSDRMALGFYRYAAEKQLRIPEEIAVVGCDDDAAGAFAVPTLTTLAASPETGAGALLRWLDGDRKTGAIGVPVQLIPRESI